MKEKTLPYFSKPVENDIISDMIGTGTLVNTSAIALSCISLIGSILIFCVGVNLFRGKQIRVANMLPSLVLAIIAAFLPL